MSMLLPIHIVAGGLAILFGFGALFVKKGGTLHRRSGMLFVYAMLVMGITASILEFLQRSSVTNLIAALLSMYFVGTALTTVRPPSRWTRAINVTALTLAVGLALASIVGGIQGVSKPGLSPSGVPFRTIGVMSFVLATALLLAAAGDVRIMRSGPPRGGPRLARHLWRMCFALFIAAGSFFSIRQRVAKILPEFFTTGAMRALPILLLFAMMFYWLWKVRRRPAARTALVLAMLSFSQLGCFGTEEPEQHLSGPYVLLNAYAGGSTYLAYRQGPSTIGRVSYTVVAAGADENHVIARRHPDGNTAVTEYYIVDRSKDRFHAEPSVAVVGPLDDEQFAAKRREMNVSPALDFTVVFED